MTHPNGDISKACQRGNCEACFVCNHGCHDEQEKIADSSLKAD